MPRPHPLQAPGARLTRSDQTQRANGDEQDRHGAQHGHHPEKVSGVVAVCGGIPGDWDEGERYRPGDVDVLYIAGAQDEFYPRERVERFAGALGTRARSVDLRVFDSGHEVPRGAAPVIDEWLREKTAPKG